MVCKCPDSTTHLRRAEQQASESESYEKERLKKEISEAKAKLKQLDFTRFSVVKVERIGLNLVLQLQYDDCPGPCSGKVMVFVNVSEAQVLRWRKIDPHFRMPPFGVSEAPSPAARFPVDRWGDAVNFARVAK